MTRNGTGPRCCARRRRGWTSTLWRHPLCLRPWRATTGRQLVQSLIHILGTWAIFASRLKLDVALDRNDESWLSMSHLRCSFCGGRPPGTVSSSSSSSSSDDRCTGAAAKGRQLLESRNTWMARSRWSRSHGTTTFRWTLQHRRARTHVLVYLSRPQIINPEYALESASHSHS
jgi:hypothetical protein